MMELEFGEVYYGNPLTCTHAKYFRSLNGLKPSDMEVRQHFDFWGNSKSHDGHFFC